MAGLVNEGVVLEVKVLSTASERIVVTRERVHRALRAVTGAKEVPNRPGAWRRWLESEREETVH